jgi:hypothetical protein
MHSVDITTKVVSCVLDTTLCDKACLCNAEGQWFSPCTPVSSNTLPKETKVKNIIN